MADKPEKKSAKKPAKKTSSAKAQTQKITKETSKISSPSRPSEEARNWAMACHLSAFAGLIVPFGNIIAPLVIWLLKRKDFSFVSQQGREAVNFQISFTIYYFVAFLLIFILIGIVLLPILMILQIIFIIIASIKVQNGEDYRYPLTIRFLT